MITSQSVLSQIEDEEAVTTDLHAKPTDIYDVKSLQDALRAVLSEAQRIVESSHSEASIVQGLGSSGLTEGFSQDYLARIFRSLSKIEHLMASYTDNTSDPQQLWQYIQESKDESEKSQIYLDVQTDLIRIYLPYLPRRGEGYEAPVNKMLAAKIYATSKAVSWPKWTAAFVHVYPTASRRIPKDVDNFDYKKTIDLLAFLVGSSDNACNYSMCMDTIFSDSLRSGVYIRITPKSSVFSTFDVASVFAGTPLTINNNSI